MLFPFLVLMKVPQYPEQERYGKRQGNEQKVPGIDGNHCATLIPPSLPRPGHIQARRERSGTPPAEIAVRKNGERKP